MAISFVVDLPPGATIVGLFGAALMGTGLYGMILKSERHPWFDFAHHKRAGGAHSGRSIQER